jgi:hypothetical protein
MRRERGGLHVVVDLRTERGEKREWSTVAVLSSGQHRRGVELVAPRAADSSISADT